MRMTEEGLGVIKENQRTARTTDYCLVENCVKLVIPLQLSTARQGVLSMHGTIGYHGDRRTANNECQLVYAPP